MTVETIRMKIQSTALRELVHKIHSDVQITVAFQPRGIAMEVNDYLVLFLFL